MTIYVLQHNSPIRKFNCLNCSQLRSMLGIINKEKKKEKLQVTLIIQDKKGGTHIDFVCQNKIL